MPDVNEHPNADAVAAMDAAIAGEPMPEPTPEPAKPDEPAKDVPADEPKPGDEPPEPKEGDPPKEGEPAPAEKKPADKPDEPAEPDPVEAEIATLGAKGKTADRIRDLSAKVAAAEPLRAELEGLGVKSVEDVQQLARDANNGLQMIDLVQKTGASEEEYSFALDWLTMRSRGRSGDVKAAEEAFEVISIEYATLAKLLGKPVPGVFDPLEGHADLLEEVQNGDITKARALELANQRNLKALADEGMRQRQGKETQTQALTQGMEAARVSLNTLGQTLGQEDAARLTHYHGNGTLQKIIGDVKSKFPNNPEQWATQTELAYRRLPSIAPKPTRPAGSPVRSSTPMTPSVIPDFKDLTPEAAMDLGISGG